MSSVATRTCYRCVAAQRGYSTIPFTAPRILARLPQRAGQAGGPSSWRFYSESEILAAAKAKLGITGEDSAISEAARRRQEPLSQIWDQYAALQTSRAETLRQLKSMKDAEMKELFEAEISELDEQMSAIVTRQLPSLLLPPESTDGLPIMLSLNAGIGGDEATACTAILAKIYQRHAEVQGWTTEVISHAEGAVAKGVTGVKEMTMKMTGKEGTGNVYEIMRFEGGVHRFQRIPPNDSKNRVQSSTVAVIVLPIIPEGTEAELVDPKDVKMEVMRSRGAGGQHVNKTESAVRLTHLPTGITVSMQDSRSQHQNRAWAWDILRSRLFARKQAQLQVDRRNRRQEVITGTDRSDRIRSYAFPADRVTDHRIGFATGLEAVLNGDLEPLVHALTEDYNTRRIQDIIAGEDDVDP